MISEESPEVARRIVARLKERRAVLGLVLQPDLWHGDAEYADQEYIRNGVRGLGHLGLRGQPTSGLVAEEARSGLNAGLGMA